jgi:hypothetical protein
VLYAAPVAPLFFAHGTINLHAAIPSYYVSSPEPYPLRGFTMNLLSPSRGLLVFTPPFLFSIAGIVFAFRRRSWFPFSACLAAILGLHTILIARYWSGHSYGPRYFADMTQLFVLFLIPAVLYWRELAPGVSRTALASIFVLCAGWGVCVHARRATSLAANQWSQFPVNVDQARWRVWDWNDPQLLRGLR